MFAQFYKWFHAILHQPGKVFWLCLLLAGAGVFFDGTAFRLWSLSRDRDHLEQKIVQTKSRTQKLGYRLQMAQKPEFIEKAARDQFDLVKEGDLVFIFSDDGPDTSPAH